MAVALARILRGVSSIAVAATPLLAQDTLQGPRIHSTPSPLIEGRIGLVDVELDSGAVISTAEAGGEPLHLQHTGKSTYRGLVGVPVEAGDSFRVSILRTRGDRIDTVALVVPVRSAAYPSEVLTVPPAFVKPDSISALRIQAEIAESREVSRRSHLRRQLWRGPFVLPRSSRITSRFGTARIFNGEVQSRHLGTDFAGAIGAPVRAAGRGVVALVADFYLAGRAIYLDHGAGVVTAYFHLSKAEVRQGQMVSAGQRIGLVGRSGRVTGPHLHWVARYGTISVDPLSLPGVEMRPRTAPDSGTGSEHARAE
jgi:murein DD-endopeptidase MepM/ murein hydrolase activator NlpD